jgi:hypothetical protein
MSKRNSSASSLAARARAVQLEIASRFPDLTVTRNGSKLHIRGAFPVLFEGTVLDRYQIEIEWSESDSEVPVLCETGGRIPWTDDRHMSLGGKACLFVPEEWLLRPRSARTISCYLDGPVHNYFLWQSLFECGKSPPWGERSHGVPGLIEAYGEMLGVQGEATIRRSLVYLSRERLKGHWTCPCGSQRRMRDCHLEKFRKLKNKIPSRLAKLALKRLQNPTVK